ncbi:MAG TPA: hypothetical protein ENH45_05585 [Nitrospirae bacterium]|nr:hypothetical protein BMS3Abin09_00805 [bacterium BMS3Abin09]GBE41594.1 hypothetical protein BMS3Bbin09_01500 [bacterium BMS3Bbin09]HDH34233.1 hypothetical protein [Nitrospirota bacterium]HDZ84675.1 hypothetical protein [Nitrospirota bacterium]
MKEKKMIIADKDIKISMQNSKKRNPVHSDQVVDSENKEKIRKLLMKKLPTDPVIEKGVTIEPDKPDNSSKKHGSHSLSELYFFQNSQK